MDRTSTVVSILFAFSTGCADRTTNLDADEAHAAETAGTERGDGDGNGETTDADPGDGDGEPGVEDTGDGDSGDGDGDGGTEPMPLEPCLWIPAPAADCDIAFEPIPAEPAPPESNQQRISKLGMSVRADAVEIMWMRKYWNDDDNGQERSYLVSNAQGQWQHEFLAAWPCGACTCGPVSKLQVQGSSNRTQLTPPYLRREGGQWQRAIVDYEDFETWYVYFSPNHFAVGPDDRSYFMGLSYGNDQQLHEWTLWAETDQGCHRPMGALEWYLDECRRSKITGMAVDDAGFVHVIGIEEDQLLVHWLVNEGDVERTELAAVPTETSEFMGFALDDSNAIHVCLWTPNTPNDPEVVYARGHDANDWLSLEIEDPDQGDMDSAGPCQLAVTENGTAWLTWASGPQAPMNTFRVASVVDDVVTQEVIDMNVAESTAALAVDPMGRPWIAYVPQPNDAQIIKVAHKEGDQWIIEEIATP